MYLYIFGLNFVCYRNSGKRAKLILMQNEIKFRKIYQGGVNCKSNFRKVIMTWSSQKKVFEVPNRINKRRKVFSTNKFFSNHIHEMLKWSLSCLKHVLKVHLPCICNFVVTYPWKKIFLKSSLLFLKEICFFTCL